MSIKLKVKLLSECAYFLREIQHSTFGSWEFFSASHNSIQLLSKKYLIAFLHDKNLYFHKGKGLLLYQPYKIKRILMLVLAV